MAFWEESAPLLPSLCKPSTECKFTWRSSRVSALPSELLASRWARATTSDGVEIRDLPSGGAAVGLGAGAGSGAGAGLGAGSGIGDIFGIGKMSATQATKG
eukprot:CAMPEP_0117576680 /NCGR_PEP_ID=MMETSP0784-20121206/62947_1 /TAXON_ID=39447 /ORGANISM="" /LENGTH=100 /DNA_ID=CAMNT_0005375989 /DNA_START=96 /DNA_END=395 /DNA_ORIENTATION=-